MKVLITGHNGFIGKNLVEYVKEHTDWSIDTYEPGDGYPGVMNYDWVMHIGAISSTVERNIDLVLKQNYDFSVKLFDECKTFGVNFQYSSSASVYGLTSTFKEDAPVDPKTPYAWSKYLFERYVDQHQGGNIVQGFRYFNVYGNHEDHKKKQASPITQFTKQAQANKTMELFENSHLYTRDFVAVEDVCRIHIDFIKNIKDSGVWNIGTGKPISFQTVANLVSKKYPSVCKYIEMPEILRSSYQKYTCANIEKLESTIGPQQFISVGEWLEKQ